MLLTIYGKKNCPFCEKAKKLGTQLKDFREDFEVSYTDYQEAGMSKEDLANKVGNPVETLPQIMIDDNYVGGYKEFEIYVRKNKLFSK
jgi:glutaredoxin 1